LAYDPFKDPDLLPPNLRQQGDGTNLDPVTHLLATLGEKALHALPDSLGFLGDLAAQAPAVAQNLVAPGSRPDMVLPGTGPVSQAVNKSYDQAEQDYTHGHVPQARNTVERYGGAASEMAANALIGGGPEHAGAAVASGAASGAAGELADQVFPNSPVAHILAMIAGGLTPAAARLAVARAPEAVAKVLGNTDWSAPVRGRVTSGFGAREAPKAGASTFHQGVDIAVPVGTPVKAPAAGVVDAVGSGDPKRGNWVELKHPDGTTTRYFHLSSYDVKPGDQLAAGEAFAKSGATGNVTGPHLHWSAIDAEGRPFDPRTLTGHPTGGNGSVGGYVPPMKPEDIARIMGNQQDDAALASLTSPDETPPYNVIQGRFGHPFEVLQDQIDAIRSSGEPRQRTKWDDALDQLEEDHKAGKISQEEFDTQLSQIGRQFIDESQSVLTPAEAQEMDASVPNYGKPPEAVDARTVGQGADYPEQVPANDVEGKSSFDKQLENHVNTPENIAEAQKVWDDAHEEYMSQFRQPDDYNSAVIRQNGGTGRKFTMPPEEFQKALDHADSKVQEFWQSKVDEAKEELRDSNPPAASSSFGTAPQEGPNRPTPVKSPEGHDQPSILDVTMDEGAAQRRSDEELTDKLANAVKTAKPVRSAQEAKYTAARAKKLEQSVNAAAMNSGRSGFFAEKSALAGKLPKVDFEGVGKEFTPEEVDRLHDIIKESPRLTQFDKIHARDGLEKILGLDDGGGSVPTHSELRLLGEAFPDKVMSALLAKRPFDQKFKDYILDASALTRALRASGDLSAPLRQGINLIGTKAYWQAFGTMFKAAKSKEAFEVVQNEIASRNTYPLMRKAGLALTNVGRIIDDREEMFLSRLAEKAPWVKHSEYAYTAFLNKLRADTFDSMVKDAYAAGIDFRDNPKALKDIATYINNATGRGDLGALSSGYKVWNAAFFSPRLIASRARMLNPAFYIQLNPLVRNRALKDWAKLGAIALTTVGLAKLGGASVETDPRSSDFGKIKIGNTRFDPYGGYQQYVHLGVVLAMGQSKSPMTGNVNDLNTGKFGSKTRVDALFDFARNKESPMAGVIDDLLSAPVDRFGQKITPTKEVVNLFVPMVEEDIRQAFQDNPDGNYHVNAQGVAAVPAAVFGSGVQTFSPRAETSSSRGSIAGVPSGYDPFKDPDLKTYDPFKDPDLKGV
jgi:hypothetical protein